MLDNESVPSDLDPKGAKQNDGKVGQGTEKHPGRDAVEQPSSHQIECEDSCRCLRDPFQHSQVLSGERDKDAEDAGIPPNFQRTPGAPKISHGVSGLHTHYPVQGGKGESSLEHQGPDYDKREKKEGDDWKLVQKKEKECKEKDESVGDTNRKDGEREDETVTNALLTCQI